MRVTLQPPDIRLPNLSRVEAMRMLGIGRHPLANLEAAGALVDLRMDRVAALATRSWGFSDAPMVIVRAGRPTMDDDRAIGYSAQYTDGEVLNASSKWWVSNSDDVLAAAHIVVAMSTFAMALLAVRRVADYATVITDRGNTVVRIAYEADLVARVDHLVDHVVREVSGVPANLEPLVPILGNRVLSPPGSPLIITRPT